MREGSVLWIRKGRMTTRAEKEKEDLSCSSSELDPNPGEVTEGKNCSEAHDNDSCQRNVPSLFCTVVRSLHPLTPEPQQPGSAVRS